MRVGLVALASALVVMASSAVAAQSERWGLEQPGSRTGFTAITAGDFTRAERRLTAERRIYPERPELMLNLAAVYSRTGREAQARVLYTKVLERPDVLMDLPGDRTASSHALAQAGLQRAPAMASR